MSDEIQSLSLLMVESSGGGGGMGAVAEPETDMDTDPIVDELDGPATGVTGDPPREVDGAISRAAPVGVASTLIGSRFRRLRGLGGFSGPYPH